MRQAIDFDRIAYFGDSLTDSDEFFAASAAVALFGIPPTAAGYAGQFSNGPVYSDVVPGLIGAEGGDALNFAVGGAQALTDNTVGDALAGSGLIRADAAREDLAFRMDFDGQIDRFLASDLGAGDLSNTAASILIGLNDFDDFAPVSLETVVEDAFAFGALIATTALEDTGQLVGAGVGTIILNTIPDIDVFPNFNDVSPDLQQLGLVANAGYDAALRQGATQLEALGVNVIIVEWGAMLEEINADFMSFGLREFDETVVLGSNGAGGLNPAIAGIPLDQIGFYDSVHPTTDVHGILGAFQAESLISNPIIGDDEAGVHRGGAANDVVLARDGDDLVGAGRGRDVVIAGLGDDTVNGGAGRDLLAGGDGADIVRGLRGRDILTDGLGDDVTAGGRGDDLIIDSAGSDIAAGGQGDDIFVFTEASLFGRETDASNVFLGGAGDDTLIIRVEDADADLGQIDRPNAVAFTALNLVAINVENVVIVEGADLSGEAFFDDRFEEAALWNFV